MFTYLTVYHWCWKYMELMSQSGNENRSVIWMIDLGKHWIQENQNQIKQHNMQKKNRSLHWYQCQWQIYSKRWIYIGRISEQVYLHLLGWNELLLFHIKAKMNKLTRNSLTYLSWFLWNFPYFFVYLFF